MRRSTLAACVLLLACSSVLPALSRADFDRAVDFSVTLKTLAAVAEGSAPLPGAKMLVLTGTVSDVTILDKEQATFRVRIELIAGEWIGLEDVKSYACYVEFAGPEFFALFPARAPRSPTRGVVTLDTRVMVVGVARDVTETALGEKRVRVQGAYVRVIE